MPILPRDELLHPILRFHVRLAPRPYSQARNYVLLSTDEMMAIHAETRIPSADGYVALDVPVRTGM